MTLIRQAQAGNRESFGRLVELFQKTIFAIVLGHLHNWWEACEVTQEVFLRAMRKLDQVREPERFPGWLCQIAHRMSINRAVRRPSEALCPPESLGSLKLQPTGPLEDLMRAEQARQIRGGLDRLGETDRQTLIAYYFQGRSIEQMSDQFQRPAGTIKRRLHVARKRLREKLADLQPA